jgi:hypothetical protein
MDWGADLIPTLGGALQRIDRLGTRHAVDYQMPPMRYTDAMVWIQALKRGKKERVVMEFPQPDLDLTGFGTGTVTGSGESAVISGAGGSVQIGQFFSIIQSGRRYLHSANTSGTSITINPMLRVTLSGATVEVGSPKIEGALLGDEIAWTIDLARTVGLSFSVFEAE